MRRVLAVAAAVLLACNGDKSTGVDSAVGVFVLQTINGSPLPFNAGTSGGFTVEVLGDQYSFNPDGTYNEQGSVRVTQSGVATTQTIIETGTWVQSGTAVTLTIVSGTVGATGSYTAQLSGNNLTVVQEGLVGVYRRS
jgi:hypothetical protein